MHSDLIINHGMGYEGNEIDVESAVSAAVSKNALDRSHLLYKLAKLIERDHMYLTDLETPDNEGSLPDQYLSDVIRCYRYFAWWASKLHRKTLPADGPHLCFTSHEPVGIVGQIISGKFLLLKQAWTLGPALCAGNSVKLKFTQRTPLAALHVASLIEEAGFPQGMVNILTYESTVAALAQLHNINKVVFMGSSEVGHQVLQEVGVHSLKKVTLCYELGFKGLTGIFVFDDADLNEVVEKCYFAPYLIFYKDQPLPLTYVQESIYATFMKKMTVKFSHVKTVWDRNCIAKFKDIKEAITHATSTKFGFATIYTTNVMTAQEMAVKISAGTICINCFDAFNAQAPHLTDQS